VVEHVGLGGLLRVLRVAVVAGVAAAVAAVELEGDVLASKAARKRRR